MYSLTFSTVGQLGTLNSTVSSGTAANYPVTSGVTFLANDAAITSAWASIQSVGTFVDGNGNVQNVARATFWINTQLDANGRWASGDVNTSSTNSGQYVVPTPDESVTGLDITGDLTVGGTADVTGAATLGSTLALTGAATLGSTLALTGAATLSSTLAVTGASTLTGSVTHGGNIVRSNAAALTAAAGGAQAGTALTKEISRFTTVGTADDSAQLPVSVAGIARVVINATATEMKVFGQTGDTINALSANTGIAIAAGATLVFHCPVAGAWYSH